MSLGGCIVSPGSCIVGNAADGVANALLSGASSWIAQSTTWVYGQLAVALTKSSDPSIVTSVALPEFRRLLLISPIVAVCALLVSILGGLRRGDPSGLIRETAIAAPLIIIGVGAAPTLALLVLHIVDGLCQVAAPNASVVINQLSTKIGQLPTSIPGFGVFLFNLAGVFGAMLLWFELVIRGALLALLLALTPVVIAAGVWQPARRLAVRLAETFVAAALAKFVVVVALSMGAVSATSDQALIVITGVAVVLLSVLAPFALMRVVPLLEMSAIHAVGGLRQAATGSITRTARGAMAAAGKVPIAEPQPSLPGPDLGIEDWPASPPPDLPDPDATRGDPPVGAPTRRTGHAVIKRDRLGPVLGWHFDE